MLGTVDDLFCIIMVETECCNKKKELKYLKFVRVNDWITRLQIQHLEF